MKDTNSTELSDELYREVLQNESVITFFQPIVSVKKRSVIGFEALSRGSAGGKMITPGALFNKARTCGTALEFDRLCRKKAIETFSSFFNSSNNDYMLSVNIDSSVLIDGKGSNHFLNTVESFGMDPSSIIIEVLESEVRDIDVLYDFVERYRKYKFLIAIDDIGSGFSNLERVISLRPDVIKIDRFLVTGIRENFYRQEVVKSIISMAHGIGATIIAEGVETEEDAIACLELGSDYLQGYYFSRPDSLETLAGSMFNNIESTAERFRDQMLSRIKDRRIKSARYDAMIEDFINNLSALDHGRFDDYLKSIVQQPGIECVYLINDSGIQVSDTVYRWEMEHINKKLFSPDPRGTDQSYKNYFFYLKSGLKKFTSNPYISGASGKLCITISSVFRTRSNIRYVLCCDIIDEEKSGQ